MNVVERKKLFDIIERLEIIKDEIEELDANEWEKWNNIPENLQSSERFAQIEEIANILDEANDFCDELLECLDNAVSV